VTLCGLGIGFLLLVQLQVLIRQGLAVDALGEAPEANTWWTLGGTIDFYRELLVAVKLVPDAHPFFHESTIVQFLVGPIPRALWPGKPASEIVRYFTLQRWGTDIFVGAGNVLPGLIGQGYMSWGVLGVAGCGVAIAALSSWLDARAMSATTFSDPFDLSVMFMFAAWLFLSFRVLSPGFLYPILVAALIVHFSQFPFRWAGWFGVRSAV
jgi:hypothetical protein